jgi:hypothetical protein
MSVTVRQLEQDDDLGLLTNDKYVRVYCRVHDRGHQRSSSVSQFSVVSFSVI